MYGKWESFFVINDGADDVRMWEKIFVGIKVVVLLVMVNDVDEALAIDMACYLFVRMYFYVVIFDEFM